MHQVDISQIITGVLSLLVGAYILVPHFRNARAQNPQKPFYLKAIFIIAIIAALFVVNMSGAFFQSANNQKLDTQNSGSTTKEFNSRINSYFIAQYIRNRESFLYDSLAENYNVVRLMSEQGIYQNYLKTMTPNNPESNAARLGHKGNRSVKFESLTFVEPQVAEVHFTINEKSSAFKQYNKIARMKFEYVKMNLTTDEQLINPLGFRVLEYHLEDNTSQN